MRAAFECDKVLLVQAELDGELDAAAAAALAAHRAGCPICRAAAAELAQARGLVAETPRDELYRAMPDEARARLMARVSDAARQARQPLRGRAGDRWWRRWWPASAGFGLGAACAAAVALLLVPVAPQRPDLAAQIVAGHIRALQPGHLEDVVSTDKHTVKPWFDGRIDFAPPVKDLAAERFPLKGARLDYIGGRAVAALVYQRDKHLIDLYVWPAPPDSTSDPPQPPATAEAQGYNIVHWRKDGMALWAVSDLEAAQLRQFAEDWRRSP